MTSESVSSRQFMNEPMLSRPRPRRFSMSQAASIPSAEFLRRDSENDLRERTADLSAMALREGMGSFRGIGVLSPTAELYAEAIIDDGASSQSSNVRDASSTSQCSLITNSVNYGTLSDDASENEGVSGCAADYRSTEQACDHKSWTHKVKEASTIGLQSLGPVSLGVLLNILDGLSYGILLFDTSRSPFANLGTAGLSIFYVSCIVSQLVYSLGGSSFKAGVGGEMIEVVPFFHTMSTIILNEIGEGNSQAVVATTILSYAVSSVVTGVVFFLLGYMRLGSLIGFFPRHILVGCVGGVGWFLVVTGLEVTSQCGPLHYNLQTLEILFSETTVFKWTSPLLTALILMLIQRQWHHPLILPAYFMIIFACFHLIVWAIPQLSLDILREAGYVFKAPAISEPWYAFYSLFEFSQVNYYALLKTVPAMFALTFFGILHVPINVPALAASIEEDNVDIDRELIAHGVSNSISGMLGSVQNYLVYTNSLLFIRAGAEGRAAGVMLAFATAAVMVAGPSIIGCIPTLVVGALIFLLGIELVQEALWDTRGRVSRFEYFTIAVIVIAMGAWDFVYGILIGILLACASFVIEASRTSAIKATYTGSVARSTVRRHVIQRKFLEQVGNQIYVIKLTGSLFFGTIVNIEKTVRKLLDESIFENEPIRYLVFDITAVTNIDYSAAEGFARINRMLKRKNVYMLLCGASSDVGAIQGLNSIRLLDNNDSVRLVDNLNSALEWCENEFLNQYYEHRQRFHGHIADPALHNIPESATRRNVFHSFGDFAESPRARFIKRAAEDTLREDIEVAETWRHHEAPIPVMMQVFQGFTTKGEEFWRKVAPYFIREELPAKTLLYCSESNAKGFYLVESGILRADYHLEQGELYETILAGTTCGELPFFSDTDRTATVSAEVDSVVWKLDREHWEKLQSTSEDGKEIANELLRISLKLTVERFTSVTAFILISSS